jgi:hypothetical protein
VNARESKEWLDCLLTEVMYHFHGKNTSQETSKLLRPRLIPVRGEKKPEFFVVFSLRGTNIFKLLYNKA